MSTSRLIRTCSVCGEDRVHRGRGLCGRCYERARWAGTLVDHERTTWPHDELIEEYRILDRQGYTRRQIADRLHINRDALDVAISRERRRQESRAS